jgi:hypothetical protein
MRGSAGAHGLDPMWLDCTVYGAAGCWQATEAKSSAEVAFALVGRRLADPLLLQRVHVQLRVVAHLLCAARVDDEADSVDRHLLQGGTRRTQRRPAYSLCRAGRESGLVPTSRRCSSRRSPSARLAAAGRTPAQRRPSHAPAPAQPCPSGSGVAIWLVRHSYAERRLEADVACVPDEWGRVATAPPQQPAGGSWGVEMWSE